MRGKRLTVEQCKLLERNGIKNPRKFLVQKNTPTRLQLMDIHTTDVLVFSRDGDKLQLSEWVIKTAEGKQTTHYT